METEKSQDFNKVSKDFIKDILLTFPEYKEKVHKDILSVLKDEKEGFENLHKYILNYYPSKFFDILYENKDLFKEDCYFLPEINFKDLWKEDISEQTRKTIWKYLQVILFAVVGDIKNQDSFGDTAKLFEAIDEDELKSKLQSTFSEMQDMFDSCGNNFMPNFDISNIENLPQPENIQNHINSLLGGKLGQLAQEIAEETARDLNLDESNVGSVDDVFKNLFKNPSKLMNLVKGVGGKLEDKIKSGEIKESELMQEASELMKNMKNMPGMENMKEMFQKMGMNMGKKTKVNYGAMQTQINNNMRRAKARENAIAKADEKRKLAAEEKRLQEERIKQHVDLTNEQIEELVFQIEGDKPEKSQRNVNNNQNAKKKKKKKGKK